ncbi:DUF4386 domain-containing protein [Arthrobacter sp. MSA 4-2]|uniref:DUF4386 domain-containing protein n=1 Tax=Arthrobacter sp. MSA 4-2 TaxID=2794349 RepID=UPI0018E7D8CE|nr:DUF4386 domain-containing protein [Arthrobacter sp. MSA 4-2]MBJ2120220.1 DUF4386 domain-containing protein [Arthrobacter sp. MSA 4-2]
MTSLRRTAAVAGVLFLITHVTSIAARLLYVPALGNPEYITGSGPESLVVLAAFLDVLLVLAIVGTGVALYPVVRRQNEGIALGYVALRTLEGAVITAGVVALLTLVTLRQDLPQAGPETLALGSALVAFNNWTFLVGPSFICGTNTLLLAYLLYRSELVPRFIAVLGLVGGPLVFASGAAQMFGLYEQVSVWAAVAALPVFAWEVCLAVYLIARGFRSPAVAALDAARTPGDRVPA